MTMPDAPRVASERFIGRIVQEPSKPALVFLGGVHGNEPSGVEALERVSAYLEDHSESVDGSFYALKGNLRALRLRKRFAKEDLNRMWTMDTVARMRQSAYIPTHDDEREQFELYQCIQEILGLHTGPVYFIDLHTTSSETRPFLVVNDSLLNRQFTKNYPLPIILGIEEYIDGAILSFINELGYVAFGFEGGSHDDPRSVEVHYAFAMLSLSYTGILDLSSEEVKTHYLFLSHLSDGMSKFYEIFFRYRIREDERFEMTPGFKNFEIIHKGSILALSNGKQVLADRNARVFMPLYQRQGSEGFFAIRPVPAVFMGLSKWMRKLKLDQMLIILPGVRWEGDGRSTLIVDKRIARYFAKQVFHLLGYRSRTLDKTHYILKNREYASRTNDYVRESWMT